jgi:hypothetical protein
LIPRTSPYSHLWHSSGGSLWNQRNSIEEQRIATPDPPAPTPPARGQPAPARESPRFLASSKGQGCKGAPAGSWVVARKGCPGNKGHAAS